ncbi:hypothetical protein P280DRAFT_524055 [Massarina eburnea CBS 473.64]|uniref:Uncharacterized protein n=1 Tax=Massarina eburnea CBS 473.64 TaxID=1395130 RepID=A0A6A6RHG0_9PLEO|nr:hypothetical protein P280DRAFT_524055 [Massarina eburnea CBS 473.64]
MQDLSPRRDARRNGACLSDLINDIDNWESGLKRRDSSGTMFVDFVDGEMKVSYRNPPCTSTSPSASRPRPAVVGSSYDAQTPVQGRSLRHQTSHVLADNGTMRLQQRPSGSMVVAGIDPETGFEYDYDGRIIHIHRGGHNRDIYAKTLNDSRSSVYSEYYHVDAQTYDPSATLTVDGGVNAGMDGPKEKRRSQKMVTFIREVFRKIEGMGWMKRLMERDLNMSMKDPQTRPPSSNKRWGIIREQNRPVSYPPPTSTSTSTSTSAGQNRTCRTTTSAQQLRTPSHSHRQPPSPPPPQTRQTPSPNHIHRINTPPNPDSPRHVRDLPPMRDSGMIPQPLVVRKNGVSTPPLTPSALPPPPPPKDAVLPRLEPGFSMEGVEGEADGLRSTSPGFFYSGGMDSLVRRKPLYSPRGV